MIRALYARTLVLGSLGLLVTAVGSVAAIGIVIQESTFNNLLTLVFILGLGLLSLLYVVRSLPRVAVTADGLHQVGIGGWQLAWGEVGAAHFTAAGLVLEPTGPALQRPSVRGASGWSRLGAPGGHARGLIVLPRPRIGADASRVLSAHGLDPSRRA